MVLSHQMVHSECMILSRYVVRSGYLMHSKAMAVSLTETRLKQGFPFLQILAVDKSNLFPLALYIISNRIKYRVTPSRGEGGVA